MSKDVYETPGLGNNFDPILPDGWDGESDLFADETNEEEAFEIDESQGSDFEVEENESGAEAEQEAPTTGTSADDAGQDAGDDDADTASDGVGSEKVVAPRILKLKVNHKESELDINSLSDEDLVARLQKAEAFDAMKEAQNKNRFREVYEEQIASGMTEGVAKMVAANAVDGKVYSLADEEDNSEAESGATEAQPTEDREIKDFRSQLRQLKAVYPDFTNMPKEVMDAYMNGADMLSAYSAYRVAQSEKAAKSLKKENQVLKQNAASQAKAPVKGVTGGGSTGGAKEDMFLKGFDSDKW